MKENKELIIASLAAIGLIISIYMSYKTREIEYGWILGTSLIIIGSLGEYFSNKKKGKASRILGLIYAKNIYKFRKYKKAGFVKINHIFTRPVFRFQIFNS